MYQLRFKDNSRPAFLVTDDICTIGRAADHITLAAKGEQFDGTYRLTVTDMAGRIYSVKEVTLNSPTLRLDLSPSMAAGKYFISIHKTDGSVKSVVQFEKL